MTETADFPSESPRPSGWLSRAEINRIRAQVPIVYVDAVPVRVDDCGDVVAVGLLLRVMSDGTISRALVSGRVMFHERVRDALVRHIEKDLGPVALPQIPAAPQPFTVAEYFPMPGLTAFHDDRQHAVSLAFVVPVTGTCEPRQDALEVTWMSPEEAASDTLAAEMEGGRSTLVRQALASVGALR